VYRKLRDVTGAIDQELMERGQRAVAVVRSVEVLDLLVTLGGEPHRVCDVGLDVSVDGRVVAAAARQRVPLDLIDRLLKPGRTVAVRIDAADVGRVALDIAAEHARD
jgi:hypothetical protein